MVQEKRLYLYVVSTIDSNYKPTPSMSGPNIVDDLLTLGTCKPKIRTSLKKEFDMYDNYIVGISPSRTNPRRVIYITRIDECITFKQAWERGNENETYRLKRGGFSPENSDPERVLMNGDIIVQTVDGINYTFFAGVHEDDWMTYVVGEKVESERDIYLVGDPKQSRYYVGNGPIFTEDALRRYWKGYPNMRAYRVLYGVEADTLLKQIEYVFSPD